VRLPLARAFDELLGRSSHKLVRILTRHADATLDGARLAGRAARGELPWAEAAESIEDLERSVEALHQALIVEVSAAIVTPIDREDLIRISRSTHDVLENLRDFVRQCDIFQIRDAAVMTPVVQAIVTAIATLGEAITVIASAPQEITQRASGARRAGREIRRTYDDALVELFGGRVDADMLKRREALRRLDIVGLRIREAGDALTDAAVKRNVT
jgi:uncharacterized protein Yka (UPF0111/DUF47 family)